MEARQQSVSFLSTDPSPGSKKFNLLNASSEADISFSRFDKHERALSTLSLSSRHLEYKKNVLNKLYNKQLTSQHSSSIDTSVRTTRKKIFVKKLATFLLSSVGSCLLLVVYTIFGAHLFVLLEAGKEISVKKNQKVSRTKVSFCFFGLLMSLLFLFY